MEARLYEKGVFLCLKPDLKPENTEKSMMDGRPMGQQFRLIRFWI